MATSDNDFFSSLPQGWRGLGYIVLSSEFGPSDQTDIDRTVFLDPLGRWSLVPEKSSDWSPTQGGRPRGVGGRPRSVELDPLDHEFYSLGEGEWREKIISPHVRLPGVCIFVSSFNGHGAAVGSSRVLTSASSR